MTGSRGERRTSPKRNEPETQEDCARFSAQNQQTEKEEEVELDDSFFFFLHGFGAGRCDHEIELSER